MDSKSIVTFILLFQFQAFAFAFQKFAKPEEIFENDSYTKMEDFPCPLASEIYPCECYVQEVSKITIHCDGVFKLDEITRIFSVNFPINDLEQIIFISNDYALWDSSRPISIPKNIFQDKTAKHIWIYFKVEEIHPEAFLNTAGFVEELAISGLGLDRRLNPLDKFPLYILEDFPNLKRLIIQQTMLSDETFLWSDDLPKFEELMLLNLGKFTKLLSHL